MTTQTARVIVGVDTSMAGLRALRLAAAEARRREAQLHAVRVWSVSVQGPAALAYLRADMTELATRVVADAFAAAMGNVPSDLRVVVVLPEGEPARALIGYADREDDLLVIGTGRRGALRRLVSGSVAGYCVRHAGCPVLVVPPTELARQHRRLSRSIRRATTLIETGGQVLHT